MTGPRGPVGLGSGWVLDLGAGEAPYDDGPRSVDPLPEDRRSFSDTVLQMSYGGRIWPGGTLFGGVAATRYQDEPILEGLDNTQFAWVVVGIRMQF